MVKYENTIKKSSLPMILWKSQHMFFVETLIIWDKVIKKKEWDYHIPPCFCLFLFFLFCHIILCGTNWTLIDHWGSKTQILPQTAPKTEFGPNLSFSQGACKHGYWFQSQVSKHCCTSKAKDNATRNPKQRSEYTDKNRDVVFQI